MISGPGVTNVLTPVAQAHHDSKPLLVISGAVSAESHGRGPIHDLPDQRALTAELTAFSHQVEHPGELPEVLARAFDSFASGRPRPVHIAVPVDVLSQRSPRLARIETARGRPSPPASAIAEAAELLAHAHAPVIILGGGAVDAGTEALRLAERTGAAIGVTINGKGAIPSSHPLCVGATLSFAPVVDMIRAADVLVAVGTEFSELDWWGLDAPLELDGTTDPHRHRRGPAPGSAWRRRRTSRRQPIGAGRARRQADRGAPATPPPRPIAWPARWPHSSGRPISPSTAPFWTCSTRRCPGTGSSPPTRPSRPTPPITCSESSVPRSWMMPVGFGTLGCALPMAIGAKLAAPDRPVACLAGDGGVLFTLQELATARDLGLGLPIIVWNNDGYGEISDSMLRVGIEPIGTAASPRPGRDCARVWLSRRPRPDRWTKPPA